MAARPPDETVKFAVEIEGASADDAPLLPEQIGSLTGLEPEEGIEVTTVG